MAESRGPEEPGQPGDAAAALAPEMDGNGSVFLERPPCSVFELSIPARIEAVGPLCAFLNMVGQCHGLETTDLQCIEISAYETCLNIIEHAYGFDPDARIRIRIDLGPHRVYLAFMDEGVGMNPDLLPPPDLRDPKVRRRGRGFGLQIIRKSMDRMRYRRGAGGANQFVLMKNLARNSHNDSYVVNLRGGDVA